MAVSRVRLSSLLLLVVFFCICSDLGLGHQSPASHHSCSHDHHHHHHHDDSSVSHHDHDHDHHHSHDEAKGKTKKKMLPEELAEEEDLKLYGFGSGSDHHDDHDHDPNHGGSQLSGVGLWVKAMGCSLLVSMASLICLTIIPVLCAHGNPSKGVVDALALFGAGAMLGDAFLHQLPHAFSGGHSHSHDHHDHSEHSHSHSHSHSLEDLSIGLSVLSGIVVFLIVEKIVRFIEEISGGENSWAHAYHHHHHHHHKTSKKLKDDDGTHDKSSTQPSKDSDANTSSNSKPVTGSKSQMRKRNTKVSSSDGDSDVDAAKGKTGEEKTASQPSNLVFGYLNLFSDGVHNFTDGMALGSAFLLHGSVGGWSRTLFLLAHELPQEVGDFGILVRSGFSVSKALFFNFLSALVALAGTALALLLGKDPGQSSLIEGFTAGGFIYISVAGVLAEMNNNGSTSPRSSVTQLASLLLGMGIALYISLVE